MQRILELINEITASYPNDRFFADFRSKFRSLPQVRAQYRAYDRAFAVMDSTSWSLLKRKAITHFPNHRTGQLKEGFFNQLNEAFAYQFLVRRGYSDVGMVPEDGVVRPDIAYRDKGQQRYCEVKTIGLSQDEIARRRSRDVIDESVYTELESGFLRKLDADLCKALSQIEAQGSDGLVFVVVLFDDFTLDYYAAYRKQINTFLQNHRVPEVFVKVGLQGSRRIHKTTRPQLTNSV